MMGAHIGIVACSAEGAALCYRTICAEGAAFYGPHGHPEVSMHTHPLAAYVKCLDRGDIFGVGEIMLSSARKLAAGGAQILICPDNTIHQAMDHVRPRSKLPWLHIAEVVAEEARKRGFSRIGITGTRWLVESNVYPAAFVAAGLEFLRPDDADCSDMQRIIMSELVLGVFRPDSMRHFIGIVARLKEQGCDAVVLGCTEIPLLMNAENSPLPPLDSTRLLARAALHWAVGQP